MTRKLSESIIKPLPLLFGQRQSLKRAVFAFFLLSLGALLLSCSTDPGGVVFDKAEKQYSMGDVASALSQYQYVVDKHPESVAAPTSQYRIAQIYNHNLGDRKKALEAYSTLYFMYPNAPETIDARVDLAVIYASNSEHRLAIEQYQKLLTERPSQYAKFQYLIAMEYIMLNDFKQARVEFIELLSRASGELVPEVEYQIANTFYIEGNLDDAMERYRKLIANHPESPFALNAKLGIAKSLSETGMLSEAMAVLKELKDKYPNKDAVTVMINAVQVRLDEAPGSKSHATAKN